MTCLVLSSTLLRKENNVTLLDASICCLRYSVSCSPMDFILAAV